ncbi:NADH oxidase [Enterococcus faecium]|uniref:FAD-dependent oxidoreductase n=1 Tax=Enterococcus faecium TaxID=1352 RepID=UPI0009BEFAF3|nr:FAD-dependent oxidoreductase [Enterococcus faecium]OQO64488.1 NADH oxidase [Enterococcus faecium]
MEIRIIGGSHAGIACAIRAREEFPDSKIVIYEKQKGIGFIAQSIPYYLSGDSDFLKLSSYITITELEKLNIMVKTQTVVEDINVENKTIHYIDLVYGNEDSDKFDKLVLATGSYPSLPLVRGDFQDKLYVVKKLEDAVKLKKLMHESRSCIIIGGGAIGVELSKILNNSFIDTTLIHSSDFILNRYLDKSSAEETQNFLESKGIKIYTNSRVSSIEEEVDLEHGYKKISRVKTSDGKHFIADGVIYATGFRPNSFLVADKLELGDKGAILVDEYMQTSHPDIFAVGDCSTTSLKNVKTPTYVPHASDAIRQGDVAAVNLGERKVKIKKSQGTYKLNFDNEFSLCMTGLTLEKAKKQGFDCEVAFIRDDYVNSDKYFEMWLVYEKVTHRILGMQCKGSASELGAQVDIISLAIQNDMSVSDIEYTDFYFKHGFNNPRSFTKMFADKIRQNERMADRYL